MTESPTNLFTNLSINKWYKYLLYLGGIILIFSLFFETKGIDQGLVRVLAFKTVIFGLIVWIIETIYDKIIDSIDYEDMGKDNFLALFWISGFFKVMVIIVFGAIIFKVF